MFNSFGILTWDPETCVMLFKKEMGGSLIPVPCPTPDASDDGLDFSGASMRNERLPRGFLAILVSLFDIDFFKCVVYTEPCSS